MTDAITILVVDDHAVVREGLRTFLELQDGLEVVGEAGDGEQALEQAAALHPDVVLMDLVMPKLDGVGAMRRLRADAPRSRVIALTSFLGVLIHLYFEKPVMSFLRRKLTYVA